MSSDNFLLIVPEGWTEIEDGETFVNRHWGIDGLISIIADSAWGEITSALDEDHELPFGMIVGEVRFFQVTDENRTMRLWIRFVAE